jgi:hypothetical protein
MTTVRMEDKDAALEIMRDGIPAFLHLLNADMSPRTDECVEIRLRPALDPKQPMGFFQISSPITALPEEYQQVLQLTGIVFNSPTPAAFLIGLHGIHCVSKKDPTRGCSVRIDRQTIMRTIRAGIYGAMTRATYDIVDAHYPDELADIAANVGMSMADFFAAGDGDLTARERMRRTMRALARAEEQLAGIVRRDGGAAAAATPAADPWARLFGGGKPPKLES